MITISFLAVEVIGGLWSSTILALLVLPAFTTRFAGGGSQRREE